MTAYSFTPMCGSNKPGHLPSRLVSCLRAGRHLEFICDSRFSYWATQRVSKGCDLTSKWLLMHRWAEHRVPGEGRGRSLSAPGPAARSGDRGVPMVNSPGPPEPSLGSASWECPRGSAPASPGFRAGVPLPCTYSRILARSSSKVPGK